MLQLSFTPTQFTLSSASSIHHIVFRFPIYHHIVFSILPYHHNIFSFLPSTTVSSASLVPPHCLVFFCTRTIFSAFTIHYTVFGFLSLPLLYTLPAFLHISICTYCLHLSVIILCSHCISFLQLRTACIFPSVISLPSSFFLSPGCLHLSVCHQAAFIFLSLPSRACWARRYPPRCVD